LSNVQKRVLDAATRPFLFRITEEGRAFLLQEGTDQRYGARHLKRAIERHSGLSNCQIAGHGTGP
jgi:ATP-dependent Clp protease ATP-binding subunit ClpA